MDIYICTIILILVIAIISQKAARQRYELAEQERKGREVVTTALMELLWEIHQEQLRARGILP